MDSVSIEVGINVSYDSTSHCVVYNTRCIRIGNIDIAICAWATSCIQSCNSSCVFTINISSCITIYNVHVTPVVGYPTSNNATTPVCRCASSTRAFSNFNISIVYTSISTHNTTNAFSTRYKTYLSCRIALFDIHLATLTTSIWSTNTTRILSFNIPGGITLSNGNYPTIESCTISCDTTRITTYLPCRKRIRYLYPTIFTTLITTYSTCIIIDDIPSGAT